MTDLTCFGGSKKKECHNIRVTVTMLINVPTTTFQDAADRYRVGISHAHNVVHAHRASGGPKRGRRLEEVSLNRAIVLMAVSSWQALVEDLVLASFQHSAGAANQGRINKVQSEVKSFSTPDAQKTRRLFFDNIDGLDVMTAWHWSTHGGQGLGLITTGPNEAAARLEGWLRLRHAVAHGARDLFEGFSQPYTPPITTGTPTTFTDIQTYVSKNYRRSGLPTLSLTDARQCLTFFNNLGNATGNLLTTQFGQPKLIWRQVGSVDGIW